MTSPQPERFSRRALTQAAVTPQKTENEKGGESGRIGGTEPNEYHIGVWGGREL